MGINLADIVSSEPRTLEDFAGKILAIDAFNTLYQFLAIIRQPDGTPLMDHEGRVTSHLSGIIYRVSNFVAASISPRSSSDGSRLRRKPATLWPQARTSGERGRNGGGPARAGDPPTG